ncbi:MAG: tRNA 2-thiouridine(34) synthase MnmA [Candidatus Gracilibacteria bacterium]|nr:tRNA 2-thiouridine(34) synthase MnmA [Candidatus Gracilibacteria bacterium]
MKNKKVLVGLSGGVDSAVAAYLLKQEGYDVTAGFMINYMAPEGEYCPTREDIEVAREVATYLDIPFFTFNYIEEYEKKVLKYMYDGYKSGITPNPDIMCNSEIKFRCFLDEAISLGFDMVATGHYAKIEEENGIYHLLKGIDNNKDQSYFLAGLDQSQLEKTLFPIGNLEKPKVREIARDAGLPNAERKDSQGICFVGKVDLHKFLEKEIEKKVGNIVNTDGKILGKHDGVVFYTIGQRKGIQIGGGPALYVVKKDIEKNELIVGTEDDLALFSRELTASNFRFLAGNFDFSLKAKSKIRYRQEDQKVLLEDLGNNRIKASFENAQRGIASGQIIAIYIGDELIGSGIIE